MHVCMYVCVHVYIYIYICARLNINKHDNRTYHHQKAYHISHKLNPANMKIKKIDTRQDTIGFPAWAAKVSRAARPGSPTALRKLRLRCYNCTCNPN